MGLELTRISIVDENEATVFDTFVVPTNPIIDFLTRYSGVTAIDLLGIKTSLKDVHEKLKTLIGPETILCGHSLENDLHAMKVPPPPLFFTYFLHLPLLPLSPPLIFAPPFPFFLRLPLLPPSQFIFSYLLSSLPPILPGSSSSSYSSSLIPPSPFL